MSFADIQKMTAARMAAPRQYQVQYGDSPATIARKFGMPVQRLLQANPHKPLMTVDGRHTFQGLRHGEVLHVPFGVGAPGDPLTATVTATKLNIRSTPSASGAVLGGNSANDTVAIVNWNGGPADSSAPQGWAQITSAAGLKVDGTSGRMTPVTGYMSKQFLSPQAAPAPSLVQPASLNTTCPPGQTYVPLLGCVAIPSGLPTIPGLPNLPAAPALPMPGPSPSAPVLFAKVTTSGPAGDPLSDLKVHTGPSASSPSPGGASKDGIVSVVDWNAGDGTWAQIVWPGDARRPPVSGFSSKTYLVPVAAPGAVPVTPSLPVQPAALNTTCPPNYTYVPLAGCVPNVLPPPPPPKDGPMPGPVFPPTPPPVQILTCPAGQIMDPLSGKCTPIPTPQQVINNLTQPAQPPPPPPPSGGGGAAPGPIPQPGALTTPAKAGLSTGAIVGIAVGAAALIGVVGYAATRGGKKSGGGRRRKSSKKRR